MDLIILIALLLIGIILIIAEVVLIPGTTFVGVLGFICLIAGIYLSFAQHGSKVGNLVLLGSLVAIVFITIYIFKAKTWEKIALNDEITSKVNDFSDTNIYEGCVAIAVSDLKPMGTIEFENEQFEAETNGEFVEAKHPVKVIKVSKNEIIVEKLKEI